MSRYTVEQIKQSAAGRWPEIISTIGRIDLRLLDGRNHACPKCPAGDGRTNKDRFRLIDQAAGACFCNQCFNSQNGDGLSAIQWLTGMSFPETMATVAQYLGFENRASKSQPAIAKTKSDPAEHLEFLPWNPTIAGLWCLKKKPIKPEAIQRIGGQIARYRGQYTVIAIPVLGAGLDAEPPRGWVIYRADGQDLPKWTKSNGKTPEWVKVKLTAGSQAGFIGNPKTFDAEGEIWKTEGPTDLLSLLSVSPEASAFTTANGAKETPLDWIVERCKGRDAIVVHDADKPGQEGATWVPGRDGSKRAGWCPSLATSCESAHNLTLPFPVELTKGQDLRDYFAGGGTMAMLRERLASAESFDGTSPIEDAVDEAEDDPHRLARVNLERYKEKHEGRLVYWHDEWWKWKDGRYKKIDNSELRAKVSAAIRAEFELCWRELKAKGEDKKPIHKVTRALVGNVIGAMESMCAIPSSIPMPCWLPDRLQRHYIAASNGILDLDAVFADKPLSESLIGHTADWLSSFKLEYPFDPEASCDVWESYLDYSLEGDKERIAVLQEWAGYLLTSRNNYQKFLVLEGEGGNGKTVYFAAMTAMLGQENVSHVSIENFGGRFELGTTIGKSANISGDAGEVDMIAEGILKQFTGGDVMQFDRKNLSPVSVRPTAKLMAAWNSRPRMRDKSIGLWRRMILVPFRREIETSRRILGMDEPNWWIENGQAPGILNWAIVGLARLREQGGFTQSAICSAAVAEYREDSNPAGEFFSDYMESSDSGSVECKQCYDLYRHWCQHNGCKPLGNRQFGKDLHRKFPGVERKRDRDGNRLVWKYVGISFLTDEIYAKAVDPDDRLF